MPLGGSDVWSPLAIRCGVCHGDLRRRSRLCADHALPRRQDQADFLEALNSTTAVFTAVFAAVFTSLLAGIAAVWHCVAVGWSTAIGGSVA